MSSTSTSSITTALVSVLNEYSVDTVFHLAAQTIVSTANRSPFSTFEVNIRGTYNLLEACRTVGEVGDPVSRIVVASSDKAYGAHEVLPYKEDFELKPRYPYDVSKACTDMIARSYAATYGMPVAVTRLANVYGGGDFNMSRIVPDTASALLRASARSSAPTARRSATTSTPRTRPRLSHGGRFAGRRGQLRPRLEPRRRRRRQRARDREAA